MASTLYDSRFRIRSDGRTDGDLSEPVSEKDMVQLREFIKCIEITLSGIVFYNVLTYKNQLMLLSGMPSLDNLPEDTYIGFLGTNKMTGMSAMTLYNVRGTNIGNEFKYEPNLYTWSRLTFKHCKMDSSGLKSYSTPPAYPENMRYTYFRQGEIGRGIQTYLLGNKEQFVSLMVHLKGYNNSGFRPSASGLLSFADEYILARHMI